MVARHLLVAWVLLTVCGMIGCSPGGSSFRMFGSEARMADVTVPEDLMREHGVLRRCLLVYQECIRRAMGDVPFPAGQVRQTAEVIHEFIEGYHEKLEEDYLFGRFMEKGQHTQLVYALSVQHGQGRQLTEEILRLTSGQGSIDTVAKQRLVRDMRDFIQMYRPHAAREDTVLFPDVRRVFTTDEFDRLNDVFENRERELFGQDGFERMVGRIAEVEKSLGIYDLALFNRPPSGRENGK